MSGISKKVVFKTSKKISPKSSGFAFLFLRNRFLSGHNPRRSFKELLLVCQNRQTKFCKVNFAWLFTQDPTWVWD